jgi:hydrocephalus-inducing protein
LRREAAIDSASDVSLVLIEPATGKPEAALPLRVSGRATFSRYSVTPARGLHYGPVTYGTVSPPRTFEITNLGEFPFTAKLFALGEPTKPPPPLPESAAGGKGGKGKAGAGASGAQQKKAAVGKGAADAAVAAAPGANALVLGQFVFEPAEAVLQPGARQEVAVTFRAEGAGVYSAVAGIAVSERDFGDHPEGLPYTVGGESCIPGGRANRPHGRASPADTRCPYSTSSPAAAASVDCAGDDLCLYVCMERTLCRWASELKPLRGTRLQRPLPPNPANSSP